jgi:ABC-type uncharacterized transport system substrate-binding protein
VADRLSGRDHSAADLVPRNVDVIVVAGTALPYAKQATGNVPVVFVTADDPVSAGYVASFARPGGRMTGLTSLNVSLDAERLEILKAALPGVGRVGVLSTPTTARAASAWRLPSGPLAPWGFLFVLQGQIVDLARRIRLRVLAMYRRAATHVDRILKGANPGDLPVEQASTFEFVINLKAAKGLGLTIPPSLLLRADQVIE